jgi:outer membrane lipoprotein-sorting protein
MVTIRVQLLLLLLLLLLPGCSQIAREEAAAQTVAAAKAWNGNWHAVWAIEFANAPVDGPLVAEIWHAADGRLRIETLEAPTTALSGLTLVDTGDIVWTYDLRQNRAEADSAGQGRIPIASDSLAVMEWMLAEMPTAAIVGARSESLESGPAARLSLITESGDRAELWVHNKTDLPAGLSLQSRRWGEVHMSSRSLEAPRSFDTGLFTFQPPADANIIYR